MQMTVVTSGAGPRAVGAERGRLSLMIMSDTCTTHRASDAHLKLEYNLISVIFMCFITVMHDLRLYF